LAKELIARAQTDAGAPMPVLLNLSSWKDDGQPLVRWLEAEDFEKKTADVTFDPDKASPATLTKATSDAGYPSTVHN
jgi:hypothetical protein